MRSVLRGGAWTFVMSTGGSSSAIRHSSWGRGVSESMARRSVLFHARPWLGFIALIGLGLLLPVALAFIVLTQSACGC
jgi:hypothetical protein